MLENFEEILYSPPPETVIEETYKAIKKLLESRGATRSASGAVNEQDQHLQSEELVKRIIEAVSLIFSYRDKKKITR